LPVVAAGDRYLVSPQLPELDELLGFEPEAVELLSGSELVDRAGELLLAAMRFARQLPPERYDDPTPGLEGVKALVLPDGTPSVLPDGRPYIPHATSIGLVRHIVGHGVKFLLFATEPGSGVFERAATFGPLGEPDDSLGLADIERETERVRLAIVRCRPELDRRVPTYAGTKTVHEMLQVTTFSLAQHTRQLESIVRSLGTEPDGPLGEAAYRGLGLPAAIWE
jgi:hypothetical protein